jgi:uncharacterized protein YndB with AHSA1/START domain
LSRVRITRDYAHSPQKVWRALTDPTLIALWGMRAQGFSTEVGARFKFFGTPNRSWRGFIECEMLEARAPTLLRYSWVDNEGTKPTFVSWRLEARGVGTRLHFEHVGFTGVGGFLLAQFVMRPGHRQKLAHDLPALLTDLDEAGNLKQPGTLVPKS